MFVLRWALAIGRTPHELLAAVDSQDITEMMAFERLEPFGSLHLEAVVGRLCAAVVNMQLSKGAESLSAIDFMPALRSAVSGYADRLPQKPMTADERSAAIDRLLGKFS